MNEALATGDERPDHLLPDRIHGGSASYPEMVRDFQSVIGREALSQFRKRKGNCRPRSWRAWVGKQRVGIFTAFLRYPRGAALRVEAGGLGLSSGNMGPRFPAGMSACSTGASRSSSRTRTGRFSKPTRFPRG